jgi:hypothetical protein
MARSGRKAVQAAACFVLACSGGASEVEGPVASGDQQQAHSSEAEPPPEAKEQPVRVLVTGFNDWRELGEPPNVWRCRDNPSCRLLLGEAHDAQPQRHAGPLVARLEAAAPEVEWRFQTMPVTWGAFARVPTDVDVIVNLGLGVYDRFDALQLESGAYNLRRGADAAGVDAAGPIADGSEHVLAAPESSPIASRLASLTNASIAGYSVVVASAREDNSYLCNETHYHALSALVRGDGQLREVYFLHIPYAEDGDYAALADGVSGVILRLIGR